MQWVSETRKIPPMTTTAHPIAPSRVLDPPSHILPIGKIGTVKVRAQNGKVTVSNHPQYDRGTGVHGTGDPNGVTDLVVRDIPHIVSRATFAVTYGENGGQVVFEDDGYSFKRADQFLVDSSLPARRKMASEISLALAVFLDTDEGRTFMADGAVWSATASAAIKARTLEDAREVVAKAEQEYNEAMDALAIVQGARDAIG